MLPKSPPIRKRKLEVLLLASEWGSSQGGLSTMNREMAIHLAEHPNVTVSFLVPTCSESDKVMASYHNIAIVEAKQRPGYEPIDCLSFPPRNLDIDIVIGHGVKLGKQAQIIKETHGCKWVQVVHTVPEELAMYKLYPGAISKGEEKHVTEVQLCEMADLVVAVGPKLSEAYSAYLSSCGKTIFTLTPGIFTEWSNLKPSTRSSTKFRVLVFGRGDSEDFELKGFDVAAQAVAALNDRSYHLIFVGAPSGREEQVAENLLKQGLDRSQLTVRKYLENRDNLAKLFCEANLAIVPSRTEGFGLTALEALSACLPFLVSQNSGFGEACAKLPNGSSCIVDSDDPQLWAQAIKDVRKKSSEALHMNCEALRSHYDGMYSWRKQCDRLVEDMLSAAQGNLTKAIEVGVREKMSLTSLHDQSIVCKEHCSDLSPEFATVSNKVSAEFGRSNYETDIQPVGVSADEEETPSFLVPCDLDVKLVCPIGHQRAKKRQPARFSIQERWRKLLAHNETLMLKTCIRNGQVSLDTNDVEYRHPNWTVPNYILVKAKQENRSTCNGELFIITDANGQLRHVVHTHVRYLALFP